MTTRSAPSHAAVKGMRGLWGGTCVQVCVEIELLSSFLSDPHCDWRRTGVLGVVYSYTCYSERIAR